MAQVENQQYDFSREVLGDFQKALANDLVNSCCGRNPSLTVDRTVSTGYILDEHAPVDLHNAKSISPVYLINFALSRLVDNKEPLGYF